jgi:ribosome biogenesis SPOUT family RNA methylase Rps3
MIPREARAPLCSQAFAFGFDSADWSVMLDRTAELRGKGFERRRLGPVQMTTDTAVRVTRMVIEGQVELDQIPFVDFPELKLDRHETTQMPFRYVKGSDGKPVMPEVRKSHASLPKLTDQYQGMLELIRKDAEKGFGDLI